MLVFAGGRNPEYNPRNKDENQQQTQPTYDARSGNRTRATAVGGVCHPCSPEVLCNHEVYKTSSISLGAVTGLFDCRTDLIGEKLGGAQLGSLHGTCYPMPGVQDGCFSVN